MVSVYLGSDESGIIYCMRVQGLGRAIDERASVLEACIEWNTVFEHLHSL